MKPPTIKPLKDLNLKELQFVEQELQSHIKLMEEHLAGLNDRLSIVHKYMGMRERGEHVGNGNPLG